MAPNDPPPAPTASVAYASGLAAVTPVFVFGADAAITQPAVTAFPTDALTLSFWINTTNAYAGVVLVSYDATPAPNPHRLWIKTPGNLEVGIGAQSTGPTGIAVADGAWHHVAVTLAPFGTSRWSVAVYKDGIQCWAARAALSGSGSLETGGDLVLGQGVSGESGLTGQMSEFRLLRGVQSPAAIATAMQVRMDPQDPAAVIVWALTSAQTAGQITGAGSFAPGAPPLVFHANRSLVATFTASTPGATYDLQWSSSDGVWHPPLTGLPLAPVPLTAFEINTRYTAIVRAVLAGVPGPWSVPAEAVTLDLGQPIVSISQPAVAQVGLSWPSVDQALQYALLFYQNGGTTPVPPSGTQPGTTFDLTPQVTGNDVWTYTIAATASGATSPLTPVVAVTAPDLQFVYDWAQSPNGTLQASWTGADNAAFRYLTVLLDGGQTPVAAPLLPAATLAYVVQAAVTAGQTYTARVRALQSGAIGAWSSLVTVVIHQLLAPLVTSITADGAAHTITLAWTAPAGPAGQTFVAELWSGDGQTRLAAISPAVSPQAFQNAAIVDGASFKARVRTMADNSFGRWSDWSAITVNGLPKVQNVAARCDASANVIVSWTPVTGFADVTYIASITGPSVSFQSAPVSTNSITLAQADTHVQDHVAYAVTVQAQATGHAAGPWSDAANVTIGECGSFPPPQRPPVSDPIDPATGAFLYSNDDLAVDAVMPLIFSTYYSSAVPTPAENPIYTGTPLGNRWTHSYNTRLARDANGQTLYVLWGNLSIDAFGIPSSITGVYANTGGSQGSTLVLGADLIFTLTLADTSAYRFTFDGALQSVTDRFGHQTTLTYAGGQLQTVTDVATGQRLTFTYTGQYLQRVADDSGRHVDFDYNGADLFHVTDVIRGVRTFTYTGSSLIETIVDQRQNTAVKNVYTAGKVTSQQDARALKSGESYATTLGYRTETINGMEMIVTDVVDRAGHAITYQSRASNNALMSLRYDLGQGNIQVQQWTYDGFNNVLTETIYLGPASGYTPGQGNTTTFTYDGDGNQLTTTVPLAGGAVSVVTRTYDASNRLFTETVYEGPQAGYAPTIGNVVHYGYNADGTLRSIADALGRSITITYKPGAVTGLVDTFTDVLGNVFRCDYQGAYLQRVTNPFGEAVVYGRDGIGRVTGAQYLASDATVVATTRITYYDTSLVETSRLSFAGQPDADAFLTQYVYDANGNVHEVTGAQGTTTYESDPNNFPSSVTYPAFRGSSRTIGMLYDRDDFVQTVTYSDASPVVKQDYVSDALGQTLSYTDPNRRLYAYARTMLANQGTPFPLQETLTWPTLASEPNTVYTDLATRDPLGRVTAVTDRGQQTTNVAYTTLLDQPTQLLRWQMVVTWPPAQANDPRATIARQFDGIGRLTSVTDENGKTTTITYATALDSTTQTFVEVVTAIDPESNQEIRTYDALGRLASLTRGRPDGPTPLTRTTAFAYDVLGRLRKVTESQGASSVMTQYDYAYDPNSKRVMATIGRPGATTGSTVQYYDGDGNLLTQVDPFGATTVRTYAPWGALATFSNGRQQQLTYGFDPAGRLTTVTFPDQSVLTHTLDANGNRLTSQIGAAPALSRVFDEWNRLSSRTDPATGTVGYTYWPTDQVKRLAYPGLQTPVAYEIDGRQFLRTTTDWAQRVTRYTYRPNGQVSSIAFPNGAATVFSFDNASRLTGVSHTAAGLVVAQYAVVLDALGQPQTGSAILPLPPAGPPAAHAFTYTDGNQFATADGATIAYDGDGNFQGIQGQPAIVEYDIYGHVIGVNQARVDRFGYDVDGLRTSATLGGETRSYVFDVNGYRDAQVERGDPERVLTAAVFAPTLFGDIGILPTGTGEGTLPLERAIDRLLEIRDASQQVRYRYLHGLGIVLQEDAAGAYRVLHDDLAGNIVALTDATGAIVDRANYDPFGQPLGGDGASFMPFRFGGRYGVQDDGNGFLHMRARAYAPQQMRFLQPDYFLGTSYRPQTLNSYAYVLGNPLQGVDPLGLDTWKIVLGVGLGIVGLGGLAGLGYYLYQSGGLTAIGTWFGGQFGRLLGPRGPQNIPMRTLPRVPRVPARVPARVPTTQSPVQSTSVYNSGLSTVRQRLLSPVEQAEAAETDLFEMTTHIKSQ